MLKTADQRHSNLTCAVFACGVTSSARPLDIQIVGERNSLKVNEIFTHSATKKKSVQLLNIRNTAAPDTD